MSSRLAWSHWAEVKQTFLANIVPVGTSLLQITALGSNPSFLGGVAAACGGAAALDVAAFGSAPAERAATLAMKTRARKAGFAVISFVAHQVQPRRHPDRLRPAGRLW